MNAVTALTVQGQKLTLAKVVVSAGARVLAALTMMGTVIRMGRIQTVKDVGNALLVFVVIQPLVATILDK